MPAGNGIVEGRFPLSFSIVSIRGAAGIVVVVDVVLVVVGGAVGGGVGGGVGAGVGGTVGARVVGGRVVVVVLVVVVLVVVVLVVVVLVVVLVDVVAGVVVVGVAVVGGGAVGIAVVGPGVVTAVAVIGTMNSVARLLGMVVVVARGRFFVVVVVGRGALVALGRMVVMVGRATLVGGLVGGRVAAVTTSADAVEGTIEIATRVVVVVAEAKVLESLGETMPGTESVERGGSVVVVVAEELVIDDTVEAFVEAVDESDGVGNTELEAMAPVPGSADGEFCSTTTVVSTAVASPGFVTHHSVPPRTDKHIAPTINNLDRVHPVGFTVCFGLVSVARTSASCLTSRTAAAPVVKEPRCLTEARRDNLASRCAESSTTRDGICPDVAALAMAALRS